MFLKMDQRSAEFDRRETGFSLAQLVDMIQFRIQTGWSVDSHSSLEVVVAIDKCRRGAAPGGKCKENGYEHPYGAEFSHL
jgi:hypothetical protein